MRVRMRPLPIGSRKVAALHRSREVRSYRRFYEMPLPKPRGKQREVLALKPEGHVVVLGTAGSGKTVLALLRAAYLSQPVTPHFGKTLLLCFNKALAVYLNAQRDSSLNGVT